MIDYDKALEIYERCQLNNKEVVMSDKVINTRRLQIFELNHFMLNEFGAIFDGVGFTNAEYGDQYSFAQAVELFNTREDKDSGVYVLHSVKVFLDKRAKKIKCHDNKVMLSKSIVDEASGTPLAPWELVDAMTRTLRLR